MTVPRKERGKQGAAPAPPQEGVHGPFDPGSLRALVKMAAPDQSRPVLAAVAFKNGWAVVADGFRLARVRLQSKEVPLAPDGLVGGKQVGTFAAAAKKDDVFLALGGDSAPELHAGSGDAVRLSERADLVAGTFPDYEQVLAPAADPKGATEFALSATYLADACALFKAAHKRRGGDGDPAIVFRVQGPNQAVYLRNGDGAEEHRGVIVADTEVVIMPMVVGTLGNA